MVLVRRARFLTRNLWKLGFVIAGAVLLTARGGSDAPHLPQLGGKVAAAQSVPCGLLPAGIVTWNASSYILPISPGNDPFPDPANPPCAGGVVVGPSTTLVLDASGGPIQIFSSGAGLNVEGGVLETANTDAAHTVSFQAAADVASWDGINITASGNSKGNASLSYISIQGALRSIQISSGATSSPADSRYGLTVSNSGIGFSYFDGIDATDTPISVTGLSDGKNGTINNIGSIGISASFDASSPAMTADALHVDGMTFGSSAPFGVSACPSNQPCYIGNQAIFGSFTANAHQPVFINHSSFYRAGTYGVQLESANQPVLTNNLFVCNGLGAPTTGTPCSGSGPVYSAVNLNQSTAKLAQNPADSGPTPGIQISGNHGFGNGLDAIAFNGTVVAQTLTWQNATNAASDQANTHWLGYLLTGDLNLVNGTLVVGDASVVKTLGGTINLTSSRLDASSGNLKTFTSLRDPIGIASCPSVFAPSCGPAVLPGGEWGGINISGGSSASINQANIFYATTGVRIVGGTPSTLTGPDYALAVANSTIGPTFSDGIFASGTPISITGTSFRCVASGCQALAAGDHGISADFTGSRPSGGGLHLVGNTFFGSVNEAIKGTGLAGQTVDIENNSVDHAGVAGIQLVNADHPTVKQNTITNSGTGSPTYPAIYLNGVANADFNLAISGNTGARNGLDGIAFHGSTGTTLNWMTIANSTTSGPLGYLVDSALTVTGGMILHSQDYVPSGGSITVTGGALSATGSVVTSLKDSTANIPTCGSLFDQRVSSACPRPAPGDWGGFDLDSAYPNALSGGEIRYAGTAITMGKPGIPAPLTLNATNLRNLSGDGISTQSSLDVTNGAFTNIAGRAFNVDLAGSGAESLSIAGAAVAGTGSDGILASGLGGDSVRLDGTTVDHAGATGIDLVGADHLTLTNNTVTATAAGHPAIYLNGFSGPFSGAVYAVSGNQGGANGLDALVFHGSVTDDLTWITARKTGAIKALGYLLDGDLSVPGILTVGAGDIVKSGGALNLGRLRADDTSNASQKVFTSLSDDSAGLQACGSVLLPGCTGAKSGDWGGINLLSDGALVNGVVRYASTGINIGNIAGSTFGSSSFGLLVSRSRIDFSSNDAIDTAGTPISVTNSSISNAMHGISADFTSSGNHAALRLSGNRFSTTSAEAILGQALGTHPVWITDNQVQAATTFGVRLAGADQLVLRNNNVTASGGGPTAGSARYPAIYLSHVSADFSRDVRGNVGNGNGLDALMMDGTAVGGLSWISPTATAGTHTLGYLLDGALTVQGGTMTVRNGDVVKGRGGPITIKGATLNATGATFTSLTDPAAPLSCPSAFATFCGAAPGDWGGLVITQDGAGQQSIANITGGAINYAETGLATDNGPIVALKPAITLSGVTISNVGKDGVNSLDTPVSLTSGTSITGAGSHGVIASFFSPANCPVGACERFRVSDTHITGSSKDAIVANGLGGQPAFVNDNVISGAGTYGIRLVGADILTASGNNVTGSGTSAPAHPAIYLSGVSGDFQNAITGNLGSGNGLNALVFHGVANGGLTWLTPTVLGPNLGYMLDGPLTVNGNLTTTGVVKVLAGAIKVNGVLNSTDSRFTSMKEDSDPSACGTIFVPSGCPGTVAASDYWGGINVDPIGTSIFTGGSITDASSGITMNSGELDMTGATITNNSGYAVHTTGTGSALITCSGIHGNGGGIKSDGSAVSIDNSDLYGNASTLTKDLDGTTASTASRVWWGAGTPDALSQYNPGTVTVTEPLPQQAPTVKAPNPLSTVTFSSDNTNNVSGNFGKGTLTVSLKFDRTMNVSKALTVNFSSALDNLAHPVTGNWTDRATWVGTAPIDGTDLTGHTGANTLSIGDGASCMRDGANVMGTETAPFTLDFTTATVDDTAGAHHIGTQSAKVDAVVNPMGWSKQTNPSNPATETYAFVESAPVGTALPDPATVIHGINPATLPGYTVIGHGSAPLPVSQTLTGLTPNTDYHYAFAAVELNGAALGPDQAFTTTGPVTHYDLASTAGNSTTAGNPYPFSVTAKDSANRIVEDYTGTVHFDVLQPDSHAILPVDYQFKAYSTSNPTGDDGTQSFGATLTKATNQSILANDTLRTIGGTLSVTVNPAAASQLAFGQQPTNAVAGVAIAPPITVFVEDRYGNVETGDTGTENQVTMSVASSGPSASLRGTKQQNDVKGVATFNDLNIQTANNGYVLQAASGGLTGINSAGFNVSPAAAAALQVTGLSSATAGVTQSVTVIAKDAFSNTATGYTGTVHFTSSDGQAALPSDYVFLPADNGSHAFAVTLKTAGSQMVTATDTLTSSITGSESATVSPASASTLNLAGLSGVTAGVGQTFTVTAMDPYSNTATGYSGTVHFTSSDVQAGLPADYTYLPTDHGSHAFAVTLKTAGSQTVTATDTLTSSITGSESAAVSPSSASSLNLAGLSGVTAGVGQTLTVTAKDPYSNTATGYTGTVRFASPDGQAVLPADYTFGPADNGSHPFSVTLKAAGSQTVTATDTLTSSITGSESATVSPALASSLTLTGLNGGTAGVSQTAIVSAVDPYNNVATGYAGTVHFSSSDVQAQLPADYTFVPADNGSRGFPLTLKRAGSQLVTVTDTVSGTLTATQSGLAIIPAGAATLQLTGLSPATAGTAQSVTLTAVDAFDNTATGYTGRVHFSSSDAQASLPADYTFLAGDNGVHSFLAGVTLKTAGSQSVTATDAVSGTISGGQTVTISPATASSLTLAGLSPGTAGVSQTVTVTAKDSFNNTATGYTGTVHFSSSDVQAALPADYAFVPADNGSHVFAVTLKTAGVQSVTAADTAVITMNGTENAAISPAAAMSLTVTGIIAAVSGVTQTMTITAKDAFGNTATGYVGTIHFTSSDATAALPADYTFVPGDGGSKSFSVTLNTAGSQSVTATDTGNPAIFGSETVLIS